MFPGNGPAGAVAFTTFLALRGEGTSHSEMRFHFVKMNWVDGGVHCYHGHEPWDTTLPSCFSQVCLRMAFFQYLHMANENGKNIENLVLLFRIFS